MSQFLHTGLTHFMLTTSAVDDKTYRCWTTKGNSTGQFWRGLPADTNSESDSVSVHSRQPARWHRHTR